MPRIFEWMEKMTMAVSFSEANEHETARQFMGYGRGKPEEGHKGHLVTDSRPLTVGLKPSAAHR